MPDLPDLNHHEQGMLKALVEIAGDRSPGVIADAIARHAADAEAAAVGSSLINVALVSALADALMQALKRTAEDDLKARWIKAAALYFIHSDDDEHDFDSPIGFEDDAEVVNACLRFCGFDELCVLVEDYDAN